MAAGVVVSGNPKTVQIENLLATRLPVDRARAAVKHYGEMTEELQKSHWESATVKAGKFSEAVLKCLWEHCSQLVPPDKEFKVDTIINQLPQVAPVGMHDSIRLTIPRACRFVYEVSSNRGARHDSGELDPNVMDANGVSSTCSWILAELIRYSQTGRLSPPEAAELVAKLTEKKYPLFEEIDGRLYCANGNLGARKLALLLLTYRYPSRLAKSELVASVVRHGESQANARKGVSRLKEIVDDDGSGNLKLRSPGLQEAELLIMSLMK